MMINVLNEKINKIQFRHIDYPIKENMYIKIGGHTIKGLHNLKLFFEGILASKTSNTFEIGYLGEKNK
jgi:hypothetical protein